MFLKDIGFEKYHPQCICAMSDDTTHKAYLVHEGSIKVSVVWKCLIKW